MPNSPYTQVVLSILFPPIFLLFHISKHTHLFKYNVFFCLPQMCYKVHAEFTTFKKKYLKLTYEDECKIKRYLTTKITSRFIFLAIICENEMSFLT